ncbi:hypothetical protein PsorP6_000577 [Peronosclerospora sorghi]|uniref:Uncharacterized protein n=1 Tax=Peronosclerospora sorghi TaxID=230839 RepID=A0ACC0WRM9_9STRA|nr:hypothetical protein PsorP6_000577 [Peronosclerospora sorghi]
MNLLMYLFYSTPYLLIKHTCSWHTGHHWYFCSLLAVDHVVNSVYTMEGDVKEFLEKMSCSQHGLAWQGVVENGLDEIV